MTRDDDFIGQLEGYLDEYEGFTPLPNALRNAIRAELPSTRQIGWLGPPIRRFRFMNSNIVRFGLAAAAAVIIVVVGIQLLGGPNVGPPNPSPSASAAVPTPTEPAPSAPTAAGFVLWNAPGEVAITVTRASGWSGDQGGGILEKGPAGADPPDGTGMIVFEGDLWVYGDPCRWSTTQPADPATTVDELVAALSAQASRDASAPTDVTVGGYAGKSLSLHVPADLAFDANRDFTDCDEGKFGSWAAVTETGDPDPTPSRYHQGPGQIDDLVILDVNGVVVVFDTGYYAGTPAEVVDEIRGIIESATFELP